MLKTNNDNINLKELISEGLKRAFKKMIDYKKYKKTPIIISKSGEIRRIDPDDIIIDK